MRKSRIIKLLAALTVGAAVFAMAATLSVSSDDLGAGDTTVASCDTDGVTTSYTTAWDATDERYEVTTVTVDGIADACNTQGMKVTLVDNTGASLVEGTVTVAVDSGGGDTSDDVTMSPAPSAAAVTGVHVVIG